MPLGGLVAARVNEVAVWWVSAIVVTALVELGPCFVVSVPLRCPEEGGTSNLIVSLLDLAEMFLCQSPLVMLVCKGLVDLCGRVESSMV